MGRRSSINMKMVLPTLSWLAVIRLLKKAPAGILGIDAASKALLGCSALPSTPSLRYTDPYLGGAPGARRPKQAAGAALLGCASRPRTDSFRIHHVVNQEALELVLGLPDEDNPGCQANLSGYILYEPCDEPLNCSYDMIIRDGDRLLHDVGVCNESASASVMSTCSSRLSNCTAASSRTAYSTATPASAFSRRSLDSEESHYSSASSASFQVTPGRPLPCVSSCCSSPISYRHGANLSAGSGYSADTDSISDRAESCDDSCEIREDQLLRQDAGHRFTRQANDDTVIGWSHADRAYAGDVDACSPWDDAYCGAEEDVMDACHQWDDVIGGNDEYGMHDDGTVVAETCYSEDPLVDFQESIERMVLCQQLIGQPDELHALYCRYIQLNPPSLHLTIALAFFHTLQRLASH